MLNKHTDAGLSPAAQPYGYMHVSGAALDVTAESAGAHLYPDTWLFHFCDLGKGG